MLTEPIILENLPEEFNMFWVDAEDYYKQFNIKIPHYMRHITKNCIDSIYQEYPGKYTYIPGERSWKEKRVQGMIKNGRKARIIEIFIFQCIELKFYGKYIEN